MLRCIFQISKSDEFTLELEVVIENIHSKKKQKKKFVHWESIDIFFLYNLYGWSMSRNE